MNSEQESLVKVAAGTIACGPICGFLNLLIDPPGVGDDSEPPTVKEALKSGATDAALGLVLPGGRLLNETERVAIGSAKNIIKKELSTETLQAAARETAGEVVARKATGEAFDHVTKVQQGLRGLRNAEETLSKGLKDPKLSPTARASLRRNLKQTQRAIRRTEQFFKKNNISETN